MVEDAMVILAQGSVRGAGASGTSPTLRLLLLIGALMLAVVIAGAIMMRLRKRALAAEEDEQTSMLEHLRSLHARGELSDAEFQTLKRQLTERAMEAMSNKRQARAESAKGARGPTQVVPESPRAGGGDVRGRDNERRARPGYDLTGEKLPEPPRTE